MVPTDAPRAEPELSLETLVVRAVFDDKEHLSLEAAEAEKQRSMAEWWDQRQARLVETLQSLRGQFAALIERARAADGALDDELRQALTARRESLDLCGRMLDRVLDRAMTAPGRHGEPPVEMHGPLRAAALAADLRRATDSPQAQLQSLMRERRLQHGKALDALRARAGASRNRVVSMVVKQLLPVLDGIEEGARLARPLLAHMLSEHPAQQTPLAQWLSVYDGLVTGFLGGLRDIGVEPVPCEAGADVDYALHEPIDVEPDPTMANERIKEAVRRGYWLAEAGGAGSTLLRAAQVVVVKNPTSGT